MMLLYLVVIAMFQPVMQFPADRSEPLVLTRISEPIPFNGRAEGPVWDSIEPFPMTSYEPVAGLAPSEHTEIRMAYDDNYIYASIRAYDSDPSGIRINSLYRGRLSGDDLFHILLDTYNDHESAMVFTITPAGVKWDATISNDAQGNGAVNSDFSTYWDVVTHVDEEGWYAEVRIPFSSIGFQDLDGRVEMGLTVQRMIARKNERVLFPQVPANIDRAYFRASLAQRIILEGVEGQKPLHITPYVMGGLGRQYLLNEGGTAYLPSDDRELDAGFDIKYGISNNMTLDVTVNTDFAQAEADDQQVNLTRFDQSFPEKRQFFLERSGVFEFNTGGGSLFHSRRIGLSPMGEQVRLLGGARLTGRVGSWDIGLLNMQTDSFQEIPSENFGVIRLRRTMLNPYSHGGAMFTSRMGRDGSYNISYGFDGSVRLRGDDYFTFIWAQSIEEETRDLSAFAASRLRLHWERRTREGFAWQTTLSRSGEAYNPGVGFISRLDYLRIGQVFNYGWLPGGSSPLQWHSVQLRGAVFWRTTTGEIESIDAGPRWSGTTGLGDRIDLGLTWHYEEIHKPFPLLQRATISPGEYTFVRGSAALNMASSRLLRTRLEANVGTFYDGWRITTEISPSWNLSRHLELEASWLYNLIHTDTDDYRFGVHLAQLRVRTALNTHLSTNAFIQMNTTANIVSANIRVRYNFRDGNDLWIVINEGMNTDLHRVDPVLPRTDARTLLVKYTHTFHR